MKTTVKICLLAALALILIGCLLFVAVMTKNSWDLKSLNTNELETRTFAITEEFQNISVNSDTAEIEFLLSDNGKCSVVFKQPSDITPSASVKNGTLVIEAAENGNQKWYENISMLSVGKQTITVYLPQRAYASLLIEEDTGDIVIPKEFSFESIGITASTGDIECFASASGKVMIAASTGGIRIANASAGELALSVSTGRVQLHSVNCAGKLSLVVSTGESELEDVSCLDFVTSGSTGDLSMENVTASGTITIERSTGDVRFENCDAAELEITTDTGVVKGSLRSEKVFIVKSDTGKIDVPETITGGKCKITTDTGDIKISIL